MLVLKWKERAFIEKVNSRCFCWFPAAILVHQSGTPIWRLHTKLYKGAWNVSANNWETVGHKDLRLGQIAYILVFYNISFSWLLLLDGFQFIILVAWQWKRSIGDPTTISVPDFTHYLFSDWPKAYCEYSKLAAPRSVFEISRTQTSWLPEAFTKHNKKFDLKLFSDHVKPLKLR